MIFYLRSLTIILAGFAIREKGFFEISRKDKKSMEIKRENFNGL